MNSFLDEVAAYVLEKYANNIGNICIVTPNRRAGLFLRKHFSLKVKETCWAPSFLSIEDFANRISGCKVADNLSLLFQFYEVYSNLEKGKADSIDEFLQWGSVLLRDFDEIDSALENPSALFAYLHDAKRIETWNPEDIQPTAFQQNYLDFFKKFATWHNALKQYLEGKNLAYQGMSYRKAADKLKSDPLTPEWEKVIFAGFNALNQAEESIVSCLINAGIAEYICDSDPYYENNPEHEAGLFIRKYRAKWIKKTEVRPSLFASSKTIKVMGIARNLPQAQLAGNILDNNGELSLDEQTAVVLANENLLVPVLNALPEAANSVNVTMGYPLAKTNLYGFFEAIMQLYLTAERLKKTNDQKNPSFYYKDLIRFFSNPCASRLLGTYQGEESANRIIQSISLSNKSFYCFNDLESIASGNSDFSSRFNFLSNNLSGQINQIIPVFKHLCDSLDQAFRQKVAADQISLQQSPYFIDFESLYYIGRIFSRLELLMGSHKAISKISTLWQIFKQSVAETRLAFSGEPLEGLQVMGVLETRNLDFKNIILISANEGVLPRAKNNNSFIPFDIKRKFGLQLHSDQDAVFAFHFYRLLQRAKNIYLIYNTESGGMGSGEVSRFITQIQHELAAFNPAINLGHELVSMQPAIKTSKPGISIEKTAEIQERLLQMAKSGFSPSSLNTFISCPLKFYLEKVARLRQAEEVEETIEASTLGSVVHGVLEDLYQPFIHRVLKPEDIGTMHQQVHEATMSRFKTHYPDGDINNGKNLLQFSLAKRYIENFLKTESDLIVKDQSLNLFLTMIATEATLTANVIIEANGNEINVTITGKADRIDKLGSITRVIDYKTGKVKLEDLKVDEFDKITEESKYDKAFQLQAYTWLFRKAHPTANDVESGIFSMRNLKAGLLKSAVKEPSSNVTADSQQVFEVQLKKLLVRIMDFCHPFTQTEKRENCKYCPFQALCGRFESHRDY